MGCTSSKTTTDTNVINWIHILAVAAVLFLLIGYIATIFFPVKSAPCKIPAFHGWLVYGLLVLGILFLVASLLVWASNQ